MGTSSFQHTDLIMIGDDAVIDRNSLVCAGAVMNGTTMQSSEVKIGASAFVGQACTLMPGVVLAAGSSVRDRSSPAILHEANTMNEMTHTVVHTPGHICLVCLGQALGYITQVFVFQTAVFAGVSALDNLNTVLGIFTGASLLLLLPVCIVTFMTVLCAISIICKWLLIGRIQPARYQLTTNFALRLRLCENMLAMANTFSVRPFSLTIFPCVYLRLLGCNTRVSQNYIADCAFGHMADLVTIGEGSFLAGNVFLQCFAVFEDTITFYPASIGVSCYLGHGCILKPGIHL